MTRVRLLDKAREQMLVFPEVEVINRRGEAIRRPSKDPVAITATTYLVSSAVSELPGQIDLEILNVISRDAPVGTWSHVVYRGREYDIATPPRFSHGVTSATRHVVFSIRSRPSPAKEA